MVPEKLEFSSWILVFHQFDLLVILFGIIKIQEQLAFAYMFFGFGSVCRFRFSSELRHHFQHLHFESKFMQICMFLLSLFEEELIQFRTHYFSCLGKPSIQSFVHGARMDEVGSGCDSEPFQPPTASHCLSGSRRLNVFQEKDI